ncbi:MAG: tetratricopeptide repeat protein [Treponema sp.]|nr:tetratricopeptide repeat protein [Treponema sp.]
MTGIQKDMQGSDTLALIQRAYDRLKAPDIEGAARALEEALQADFDNGELKYALKCVHWWIEHTRKLDEIQNPFEKGVYIFSRLKQYYVFLDRFDEEYEQCQYAVRRYIFSTALIYFSDLLGDGVNQHDPELLLLIGRCYKGIGNYDEALKYLEQAVRFKREDSETLAELADVNALLAETRTAKTFFREAFFLDPQKIDLRSLESELMIRLQKKVTELGYGGKDLCEWIPVFGCLLGVFNVKRELKQVEAGRLKQSVFELEAELRGSQEEESYVKPRLLNRYFWLIDYYINIREDQALIDEILLKIKITDPDIYERYRTVY